MCASMIGQRGCVDLRRRHQLPCRVRGPLRDYGAIDQVGLGSQALTAQMYGMLSSVVAYRASPLPTRSGRLPQ